MHSVRHRLSMLCTSVALLAFTAMIPGCTNNNPSNLSDAAGEAGTNTTPSNLSHDAGQAGTNGTPSNLLHASGEPTTNSTPSNLSDTSSQVGVVMPPAPKNSYVSVDSSMYDDSNQTVTLEVHPFEANGWLRHNQPVGEQVIDISTAHGIINYAGARYPTHRIKTIRLMYPRKSVRIVNVPRDLMEPDVVSPANTQDALTGQKAVETLAGSVLPKGASRSGRVPIPPPGSKIDHSIYWRVTLTAPRWMKENAVVNEARSKLGTPYIWGHNEDRGQYGFDCSNFTAYVYHHALGYKFSGASRHQAKYVGVRVPIYDMRRGDLIIFENGKHVGIYAGHHRMIQEGGGLGKVGYLSIGAGSYWGKHITSVKRLI